MSALLTTLLLAAPGVPGGHGSPYPIAPAPLPELVERAELIIVARVGASEPLTPDAEFSDSVAALEVLETLKGEAGGEPVRVLYSPGMLCPAPAEYEKGKTVLAFLSLRTGKETERLPGGLYETVALSYGAKYYSDEDRVVAVQFVRRYLDILGMPADRDAARLAWLLELIELPAFRWDGAYALLAQERDMSAEVAGEATLAARLEAALLSTPPDDRPAGTIELIELLENHPSRQIDRFLELVIDGGLEEQPFAKPGSCPSSPEVKVYQTFLGLRELRSGKQPAPPGYYGLFPSRGATGALQALDAAHFSLAGDPDWVVARLSLNSPLPYNWFGDGGGASGKGPYAELAKGEDRFFLPVETDGDAAALWMLVQGKQHPQLAGFLSPECRAALAELE